MADDDNDCPREFTDEQLEAALVRAAERVKQEAIAAGLPLTFAEDGWLMRWYPDGHVERIRPLQIPGTESPGTP